MELLKNQIVKASIIDFTQEGDGVARVGGMVVFVRGGVPGDECEIRILKTQKSIAYAKVERLLSPSPSRETSDCPYFPACGGCRFRHISYEAELEYKAKHVVDALSRIGGVSLVPEEVIGSRNINGYRNKVQYPVGRGPNGAVYGFYRERTHEVVPISRCLNQSEAMDRLAGITARAISELSIPVYDEKTGRGLVRHICVRESADKKLLLCLVTASENLPSSKKFLSAITSKVSEVTGICLNINPENTNVIFGKKTICLWGNSTLRDEIAGIKVDLSPVSFFQVNREQAGRLYARAGEYAGKGSLLIDLYCGTGTVGLSMAGNFERLLGIEIVPEAVENARANALLNGHPNAEFICADAAQELSNLGFSYNRPDVVVVDPPRKGLSPEIIPKIAALSPEKVVYISCNPATLARDIKLFGEEGYVAQRLTVVDMFPRTEHVETVVLMSRVKD